MPGDPQYYGTALTDALGRIEKLERELQRISFAAGQIPHRRTDAELREGLAWSATRIMALEQELTQVQEELQGMRDRKDRAYEERTRLVAFLARLYPSVLSRTAIEGWSDDWHGCVYIDTPAGQLSWHYPDSQTHLFDGIPVVDADKVQWDGHTTEEKYRRLAVLWAQWQVDMQGQAKRDDQQVARWLGTDLEAQRVDHLVKGWREEPDE